MYNNYEYSQYYSNTEDYYMPNNYNFNPTARFTSHSPGIQQNYNNDQYQYSTWPSTYPGTTAPPPYPGTSTSALTPIPCPAPCISVGTSTSPGPQKLSKEVQTPQLPPIRKKDQATTTTPYPLHKVYRDVEVKTPFFDTPVGRKGLHTHNYNPNNSRSPIRQNYEIPNSPAHLTPAQQNLVSMDYPTPPQLISAPP
jgi:hypothetical protein